MKQDIEALLERYYNGETTLAEEKQLRQFFQQDTLPAHLEAHAGLFRYVVETRNEHPSLAATSQVSAKLNPPHVSPFNRFATWGLRLAASVTLLILGFAGGIGYTNWRSNQAGPNLADSAPAQEMKKVLAFEQLPKTSASERIQAVNQSYELSEADQATTQLLINTLNFDANVNVRLAACQALARFENEPDVRDALIQSLQIQTDPNIQITLIEILVAIKEKRAVNPMKQLVKNQQLLDVVRLKAKEGILRLNQAQHIPS